MRNKEKQKVAEEWCLLNGYSYIIIISNEWFLENARKIDYTLLDPKIFRGMKQFLKGEQECCRQSELSLLDL